MAIDESSTREGATTATASSGVPRISNVRLHTIIAALWLCLFISALDTTIVTTALIKISSGFNALEQGAWLVTAYLLTYNCKPHFHDPSPATFSILILFSVFADHFETQRYLGTKESVDIMCFPVPSVLDGMWQRPKHGAIVCPSPYAH
jgi:MFS family permease